MGKKLILLPSDARLKHRVASQSRRLSFLQYPLPTPSSPEETVPQLGPAEARPTTFQGLAEDPS